MKNPILITGIQRSGSTIIAKIINKAGGHSGVVNNMMENKPISGLMDEFSRFIGADPRGQYPLVDVTNGIPVWREQVNRIMQNDKPWYYKSHRICQLWKLWHEAYPEAKWIIVRRKTNHIIDSCMKTGYMTAFNQAWVLKEVAKNNPQDGWLWWIRWHEQRFLEMVAADINYREIWPERMVDGDYSQIVEMLDWLGFEWNEQIIPMVEPLLWKSKQKLKI